MGVYRTAQLIERTEERDLYTLLIRLCNAEQTHKRGIIEEILEHVKDVRTEHGIQMVEVYAESMKALLIVGGFVK